MPDRNPQTDIEFPLKGLWFYNLRSEDEATAYRMGSLVARARSKAHDARIQELPALGRCLIVDGKIRSADIDEHIYDELLVHPAMVAHPDPRRVLVCGGETGGAMREILRYRTVESVVLAARDPDVVALCRDHLPVWHGGAFNHPKVRVQYGDTREFVEETEQRFDVVVCDLLDPIDGVRGVSIFPYQIYSATRRLLDSDGVFVTQAGQVGNEDADHLHSISHALREVYPQVRTYVEYCASFRSLRAFVAGSHRPYWDELGATEVDKRLHERGVDLRFYDGETHRRIMSLPKPLRMRIADDTPSGADGKP